ncbi:hypothetical protein ACM0P6_02965 [Komagataeibacter sucrofermentans]|uniref:hypothetical protein n=1 Tax=Komagataeibacter sucrofermentans TaxID=1053551 RepID=UPI00142E6FA9|nr:hypothetical protein [Komagataeibacter sucrofermentans]
MIETIKQTNDYMPRAGVDFPRQRYGFIINNVKIHIDYIDKTGDYTEKSVFITEGTFIFTKEYVPEIVFLKIRPEGTQTEFWVSRSRIRSIANAETGEEIPNMAKALLGARRIRHAKRDAETQRVKWGDAAIPDLADF